MDTKADIPNARLKKRAKLSLIWLVPTVAAAAAGWLVFRNLEKIGPTISIQFDDGSGLVANQTVIRYRGVNIGSVRSVQLSADTEHVDVAARLDSSAKMLARNGSIFWVVRPEVGAGGLSGLETIVSGPYIQVEPGGKPGPKQDKFKGAMEAPILPLPGGGTEFILRTPRAGSLTDASPVYYRGIAVGS